MSERVTEQDVSNVARLSRLALTAEQLTRLTPPLESILANVAKLPEGDVTGVEPMAHAAPLHNVLRDDVAGNPLPLEKVLQNAPQMDGAFFQVPKVIGGDED